jgi:hypothetical protein
METPVQHLCEALKQQREQEQIYLNVPSKIIESLRLELRQNHSSVKVFWDLCRRKKNKKEIVDGLLNHRHFQQGLASMGYSLSLLESTTLFTYLDTNQDGFISLNELEHGIVHYRSNPDRCQPISNDLPITPKQAHILKQCPKVQTQLEQLTHNLPGTHSLIKGVSPKRKSPKRKSRSSSTKISIHEETTLLKSFSEEIIQCDAIVEQLADRISNELQEWDEYWYAIAEKSCIRLQTWIRTFLAKTIMKKKTYNYACIKIQTQFRKRIQMNKYNRLLAAIVMETCIRQWNATKYVNQIRRIKNNASTLIQSVFRKMESRNVYNFLIRKHMATKNGK